VSRVGDLIRQLCPEGVPFKQLGQIFSIKNGYTPSKANQAYWINGTVPWFRMEDIRENGRVLGAALQEISEEAVKSGKLFPANSILVATSATIGEHALVTVPHLSNQRFTSLSLKPQFVDLLDISFVYYYCFLLDEWCRNNTTTSSFSSVDMKGFRTFRFPVPPIAVQREIVKVLDSYTELESEFESELRAELEARRRQYEHYRHVLLSFSKPADGNASQQSGTEWVSLAGLVAFINGKPHERVVDSEGDIALITSRFISTQGKSSRFVKRADVLTPALANDLALVMSDLPNGRALARAFFVDKSNYYAANQRVCLLRVLEQQQIEPRFLYYIVDRNEQLLQYDSGVDQTHLKKEWILQMHVPVPPVEEQQRIVAILDQLQALVNDFSVSLPAELKARRQQYEYYRNRLLTFREAA
jgi:type I restriction enzyme, S subunit